MSAIWTMSITISLIFALLGGNSSALAASALEGAPKAAEFVISAGTLICLWSGVMNVLKRSGASAALARALESDPLCASHAAWALELACAHPDIAPETADQIIRDGVSDVFAGVLEDAGVFKWDEPGRAALDHFLATL